MDNRPCVLITNDDGIDSYFLHALVAAHQQDFKVIVAAPTTEQSWIGRALSRHRTVKATRYDGLNCEAWSITGTPSDCVNIALGNLLSTKPDIVISGINIGYNTTIPLIYSSGTIAGAMEGATWGLQAIAYSQQMEKDAFIAVSGNKKEVPAEIREILSISSNHAARFTLQTLQQHHDENAEVDHQHPDKAPKLVVHNVNFPFRISKDAPIRKTIPGGITYGGFYDEIESGAGEYTFRYRPGTDHAHHELTDRQCLARNEISHSTLNFSNLQLS